MSITTLSTLEGGTSGGNGGPRARAINLSSLPFLDCRTEVTSSVASAGSQNELILSRQFERGTLPNSALAMPQLPFSLQDGAPTRDETTEPPCSTGSVSAYPDKDNPRTPSTSDNRYWWIGCHRGIASNTSNNH